MYVCVTQSLNELEAVWNYFSCLTIFYIFKLYFGRSYCLRCCILSIFLLFFTITIIQQLTLLTRICALFQTKSWVPLLTAPRTFKYLRNSLLHYILFWHLNRLPKGYRRLILYSKPSFGKTHSLPHLCLGNCQYNIRPMLSQFRCWILLPRDFIHHFISADFLISC